MKAALNTAPAVPIYLCVGVPTHPRIMEQTA